MWRTLPLSLQHPLSLFFFFPLVIALYAGPLADQLKITYFTLLWYGCEIRFRPARCEQKWCVPPLASALNRKGAFSFLSLSLSTVWNVVMTNLWSCGQTEKLQSNKMEGAWVPSTNIQHPSLSLELCELLTKRETFYPVKISTWLSHMFGSLSY